LEREATRCEQKYRVTELNNGFTLSMSIVGYAAMISSAEHKQHGSGLGQEILKVIT
jgi:hypothetical protein